MMKKLKYMLLALAVLLLAGCSLARGEETGQAAGGDRLAGFYLMRLQDGRRDAFYQNPNLEEYGSISAETDQLGTLHIPRDVLFAVEDENGKRTFPGMEDGYSLFRIETNDETGHVSEMVSNMAPGEDTNAIKVTDEGTTTLISGIVYYGPPLGAENWDEYESSGIWQIYRVYQTQDGRAYLDGSGNSFSGGGMGYTESETYTSTQNGKSVTDSIEVHVRVETVPRLEKLVLTQFDANNVILRSDDLALREDLPEITCDSAAAWVLVEEVGPEKTIRTVYNVPAGDEDPISHQIVLLDDAGLGRLSYLTIR